jgi:hypothetical protein
MNGATAFDVEASARRGPLLALADASGTPFALLYHLYHQAPGDRGVVARVVEREVIALLQVQNEAGRRFEVRCIRRGDRYGLNGCLVHDKDDPVVEFTDVTPPGGPGPAAEPLFVARFPAKTFLGRDDGEVWLFGRDVAWRLAPWQVQQIREWLEGILGCGS